MLLAWNSPFHSWLNFANDLWVLLLIFCFSRVHKVDLCWRHLFPTQRCFHPNKTWPMAQGGPSEMALEGATCIPASKEACLWCLSIPASSDIGGMHLVTHCTNAARTHDRITVELLLSVGLLPGKDINLNIALPIYRSKLPISWNLLILPCS